MKKFDSDLEAALSFQRGEEIGFDFFFKKLRHPLVWYAMNIVKDKDIAEDMVSEAFLKIWKNRATLDHPKVIKGWLYKVTHNNCLMYHQHERNKAKNRNQIAYETETTIESVEDCFIKAEVLNELKQAIQLLPPACRKIVVLRYLQQKEVSEIEKILKLSKSTIKNQLARAYVELRKYIESGVKRVDGKLDSGSLIPDINLTIVELRDKNMSWKQIAGILGLTAGASTKRYFRYINNLRQTSFSYMVK